MKRTSSSAAVFLASLLFASQASGAYLETLSVNGPKASMNVSVSGMQRATVGVLLAANDAEDEDLDALSADKADEQPADVKKQPAKAPAAKTEKQAAPKKASAATETPQQSPVTAAVEKGDACKLNKDCDRGDVCLTGYCIDRDDIDDETLMKGTKYNLEGKQWALWGGIVGHALWLGGTTLAFAIEDPSAGSAAAVWGIHTASTIVPNIAANSAIDNVGVFGAPGQKFGSWFLFGVGLITFGLAEVLIAVEDTFVDTTNNVGGAAGGGTVVENPINGAVVAILTVPGMLSGILMSSVALRSHREVRRVKRRAERDELQNTPAETEKTSMRFDVVPYLSGPDNDMSGMMGQWTLRF